MSVPFSMAKLHFIYFSIFLAYLSVMSVTTHVRFNVAFQRRLLHPGPQTSDIINQYIYTVHALRFPYTNLCVACQIKIFSMPLLNLHVLNVYIRGHFVLFVSTWLCCFAMK